MAALTIRNLDDDLKRALRRQAAAHDRSMEEEARVILRQGLTRTGPRKGGLGSSIRRRVEAMGGGVEFELPEDQPYDPQPLE
jgi:plasmid stability protein